MVRERGKNYFFLREIKEIQFLKISHFLYRSFLTAAFSIVALEFPDRVGAMFAILETFFGLGLIMGPTIGGALYQVWSYYTSFDTRFSLIINSIFSLLQVAGYVAPFALLGGFLVFASVSTVWVLPKVGRETKILLFCHRFWLLQWHFCWTFCLLLLLLLVLLFLFFCCCCCCCCFCCCCFCNGYYCYFFPLCCCYCCCFFKKMIW